MTTQLYCFLVTGKVQGVGFRQFVKAVAQHYGLWGSAKNLADNYTVEVILNIPDDKILPDILEKLKAGSPYSIVDNVKLSKLPFDKVSLLASQLEDGFLIS